MKLFVFLSFLFHGADAASFNVAFAAGVAARVETVLDEPWTRALDPLAAAFNSRWEYVYDGDDITGDLRGHALIDYVHDNETISLLWTLMKPTDLTGLQGFDFIYVGFENGKNFGYRNEGENKVVLYYMPDGNATCPQEGVEIRCRKVYKNTTDQTTGKITGLPSQYETYDPRYRPWYLASQSGKFYTEPYLFNEDNNLGITAVRQIITDSGQFLGVFGVDYDLLTIDSALYEVSYQNVGAISAADYAVFVVEADGYLISTSVLGASVVEVNGVATQVYASNSSNEVIAGVARSIIEEKENGGGGGYVAANGTVLIVEIDGKGRYWAQAQKVKNGYGLNWFVVVAEPVSCDVGFYVSLTNRNADCIKCPVGAKCLGGSHLPFPEPGYWVDRSKYEYGSKFYSCEFNTCPGYDYISSSDNIDCWTEANFNHSNCDDLICATGSEGPLCGTCSEGYHYESGTRNCIDCGNGNLLVQLILFWTFAFVGILVAGILIFIGRREHMKQSPIAIYVKKIWYKLLNVPPFNILKHVDSGMGKVCWVTAQILSTISWNLSLEFPDPFDSLFVSNLQYFQLDFVPMKCFISSDNFITRVCFLSFAPIILVLINLFIYLYRQYSLVGYDNVSSIRLSEFGTSATSKVTNQHAYFALLLSYLVLPICSLVQFAALNCITFQDGSSYLRADTSIDCRSDSYQTFIALDICLIIAYQTVPMIWFALLWRDRHKLNPEALLSSDQRIQARRDSFMGNSSVRTKTRHDDYSIRYLSFLWKDYKPSKWYFEVLEMYRRTLFVAVIPLLGDRGVFRAIVGTMIAMVTVAFLTEAAPFISETTNSLLVVAQYQILFTFFVAVIIISDATDSLHLSELGLGLLLVCVNLILVVVVAACCYSRLMTERQVKKWKHGCFTQEQLFILTEFMNENNSSETMTNFEYTNGSASHAIEMRGESTLSMTGQDFKVIRRKLAEEVMERYLLKPEAITLEEKVSRHNIGVESNGFEMFKGSCFNSQKVAIKRISILTQQKLHLFRSEILLTASLRHPNIVNFIGACWGRELLCLVNEWMCNGTLGDFIHHEHRQSIVMPINTAQQVSLNHDAWTQPMLRMVMDVARGMKYLHELNHFDQVDAQDYPGVIHRLLTPNHCLLGDFACVKINNFRCSHPIGQCTSENSEVVRGEDDVSLFTAPELALGNAYTEKVDIYSFGMILASLTMRNEDLVEYLKRKWRRRKKVHKGEEVETTADLLKQIYSGEWDMFEVDSNGYRYPMVFELISKCVSFNPKDRPSFAEIGEYLHYKCQEEIDNITTVEQCSTKRKEIDNDVEKSLKIEPYVSSLITNQNHTSEQATLQDGTSLLVSANGLNRKSSLKSSSIPPLVKKTVQIQEPTQNDRGSTTNI